MRRLRGGVLEQNEGKPENGSLAPPNGLILMTYTLKKSQIGIFGPSVSRIQIQDYLRSNQFIKSPQRLTSNFILRPLLVKDSVQK